MQYLLTAGAAVAAFLAGATVWGLRAPGAGGGGRRTLTAVGVATQVGLVAACAALLRHQADAVHRYFDWAPSAATARTLAVVALAGTGWKLTAGRRWGADAAWAVALFATVVELLPAVHREGEPGVIPVVRAHLTFSINEFAAALNGATPRVDFCPQYQYLSGLALAPLFKAIGLNLTTYTATVAALAAAALLGVFVALRRMTGGWWPALALYLPLLWLSGWPVLDEWQNGGQRYTPLNYPPMPLRYLGPWATFCVLARWAARPAGGRALAVGAAAALSALNNVDFGLPAAAAAAFAVGLCAPTGGRRRGVARFAVGAAVAAAGYAAFVLARTGRPPTFERELLFMRVFAVNGFNMLPMPEWGLHWVMAGTFVGAIASALFRPAADGVGRVERAAIAFAGVFGCGAMAYYVGRSHWQVLAMLFPAWGLALVAVAWAAARAARRGPLAPLAAIPLAAIGYAAVMLFALAADRPNPWSNLGRLANPGQPQGWADRTRFVERVRRATSSGEAVGIVYPFGHLIAREAGVRNAFPYSEEHSLFLGSQIDHAMAEFDRRRVCHVFGGVCDEMAERMAAAGFAATDAMPSGELVCGYVRPFTHWERRSR